MNAHALRVIEFPAALELVAGKASSALGAERVRELSPRTERDWLDREHSRVTAVRSFVDGDLNWHPQPIADVRAALARLRVEGASLSALDLVAISGVLRSSRLTRESLKKDEVSAVARALLAPELESLIVSPADEKKIGSAIDDDGNVRDEASPQLRRIRRELRGSQGELVKLLERLIAKLEPHHQVADMSVTVRNGRFVIPVRKEARTTLGGIVHDTSSTGATLFVEPPAAVEAGNRIRELEVEEIREIDRILADRGDARCAHRARHALCACAVRDRLRMRNDRARQRRRWIRNIEWPPSTAPLAGNARCGI